MGIVDFLKWVKRRFAEGAGQKLRFSPAQPDGETIWLVRERLLSARLILLAAD